MFTKEDIIEEYKRMDAIFAANIAELPVNVSTRFKRKLGMCRLVPIGNGRYRPSEIVIGAQVFTMDKNLFYDTVRHEYAHALVTLRDGFNHGHDKVWKRACLEVGCNPHAAVKVSETANACMVSDETVRYIVRCTKCGSESKYYRKGKVVTSLMAGKKMYRCRCGGKLEVITKN